MPPIKNLLYFLVCYTLLLACAQQQQLTGGDKDEEPPKIIEAESTPNNQTNFEKQNIEFVFDEYIQIKNALKQVVISPPLERIPIISTKLKTLQFKFPEEEILKEDATYSINFGDAVKDLTEGNAVPDFKFVFSTGEYIDSLKMEGTIVDALTGKPVENALYLLYKNLADSVVYTQKPFYFGKTNKEGKFSIANIKAGPYKGFALEDQDLNYLFNVPTERIGFSQDTIVFTDSSTVRIDAAIFESYALVPKPKANVKKYGLVTLAFKRAPFDARVAVEDIGQQSFIETKEDTIKVWYHTPDSTDWSIFVHRDTITDTIAVKALAKNLSQRKLNLPQKRSSRKGPTNTSLNPSKPIKLTFNHPLQNIDTSLILFQEDSIQIQEEIDSFNLSIDSTIIETAGIATLVKATFTIDSLEQQTVSINFPWKETLKYELQLLPGAVTDLYGLKNTDTLRRSYVVKEQKDFGNINLVVSDMDSLKQYQFELLSGSNLVEAFSVNGVSTYKRTFSSLVPGKYSIKVIEDLNGNGRWDSGDYAKKLQPENVSSTDLEEVKANWDIEATVQVKF